MEPLSPITMIAREMERKHINVSELGRGLKIKHSSVVGMMQRSTLQVQRWLRLLNFWITIFSGRLPINFLTLNPITRPMLTGLKSTDCKTGSKISNLRWVYYAKP